MPDRFKLVSEVSLLLIRDGKILLLRRANTGYRDGWYCFIAGHKEAAEAATQAIIREAKEEVGLTFVPEQLQMAHVMHRHDDGEERIAFFFTAKDWHGEPINVEAEKHDDMHWFSLDALPENFIPYMHFALQQVQEGKHYSEFGW